MPGRGFDWKAGAQAAGILIVAIGAAFWHAELRLRPADAAQLHILVSRLQSQAAEATVLSNQMIRDEIPGAFARRHAAQIDHQTATTSAELKQLRVRPEHREAMATLRDIAALLDEQLADAQANQPSAATFARLVQRAQALDERLVRASQ